jgi:hypothetical protein
MSFAREEWFGIAPVELDLHDLFADEATNPAAPDQQLLTCGGMVLVFRQPPDGARFPVGKILVTVGALRALREAREPVAVLLLRHVHGDWGTFGHYDQIDLSEDELRSGWLVTNETGKINKSNLLNRRDWIISEYRIAHGQRVRILTDLGRGTAMTVILLNGS